MKEKKHIDRLFQEKFRDFEEVPREHVWKSISSKLQAKKRKKPIVRPLWSRIAGIAALIALVMLISDWLLQPQETPAVTDKERVPENRIVTAPTPETAIEENQERSTDITGAAAEKKGSRGDISNLQEVEKGSVSSLATITSSGTVMIPTENFEFQSLSKENIVSSIAGVSEKRYLFDELNEADDVEMINSIRSDKRLEVKTHAAPIYYGNLRKGSFIDDQFNNNSSEGEVTYSYGINIAYTLTKKVKLRSGVNMVSMSYNTNDIVYHAVVNPHAISSINYDPRTGSSPVAGAANKGKGSEQRFPSSKRASYGNLTPALLNQKLGFIEVPVELEYNLIDNKFGLQIIGGASTLFLDENMISVNSGSTSTTLGEANNLNEVSFSTNIGLGLDYHLTESFRLNLEPMFKYQLNTFNSAAGESQPYYLGIYSGFSFEF